MQFFWTFAILIDRIKFYWRISLFLEFPFFIIPFIVISIFLEVSLEDSIVDFDSHFDHSVKSFGAILFCNFVFNMLFEAFVKLGCKSFVISVDLFRILLEVCYINNSRFSLLKVLNNLFGGSVWINVSKDFDDFFFKVCKGFENLPGYWLLGLEIDGILEIVIKVQFDLIKSCFR